MTGGKYVIAVRKVCHIASQIHWFYVMLWYLINLYFLPHESYRRYFLPSNTNSHSISNKFYDLPKRHITHDDQLVLDWNTHYRFHGDFNLKRRTAGRQAAVFVKIMKPKTQRDDFRFSHFVFIASFNRGLGGPTQPLVVSKIQDLKPARTAWFCDDIGFVEFCSKSREYLSKFHESDPANFTLSEASIFMCEGYHLEAGEAVAESNKHG